MLPARAAETTPSAEMLLYLAEFADDSGQPDARPFATSGSSG